MNKIIKNNVTNNLNVLKNIEVAQHIVIRKDIEDFLMKNGGGDPVKDIICSDGEEYEVRKILSLDDEDKYYGWRQPLLYFLTQTKKKIIPIAVDSGDNYYCVNNDSGFVYYWSCEDDKYFKVADSLENFSKLFL